MKAAAEGAVESGEAQCKQVGLWGLPPKRVLDFQLLPLSLLLLMD